jgi:hypothetical protein
MTLLLSVTMRASGSVTNTSTGCPDMEFEMLRLRETRSRVFGVIALQADALCILRAAKAFGLLGPGYFWFGTPDPLLL